MTLVKESIYTIGENQHDTFYYYQLYKRHFSYIKYHKFESLFTNYVCSYTDMPVC